MKREEFESIIAPRNSQFTNKTCKDAEPRWGFFCLDLLNNSTVLSPTDAILRGHDGSNAKAKVILKTYLPGTRTFLVISPYPGLLVDIDGEKIRRPLMQIPRGDHSDINTLKAEFAKKLHLDTTVDFWYPTGMALILNKVVEGGIDSDRFIETLIAYENYLYPEAKF